MFQIEIKKEKEKEGKAHLKELTIIKSLLIQHSTTYVHRI